MNIHNIGLKLLLIVIILLVGSRTSAQECEFLEIGIEAPNSLLVGETGLFQLEVNAEVDSCLWYFSELVPFPLTVYGPWPVEASWLEPGVQNVEVFCYCESDVVGTSHQVDVQTCLELTVNISSDNTPSCEGDLIQLFAEPDCGVPPYTYSWSGPNGFSSTEQNPVVEAYQGLYEVLVTDAAFNSVSGFFEMAVAPSPEVFLSGNAPICEGETLVLIAEGTGGTPPYLVLWAGPDDFSGLGEIIEIPDASPTENSGTYYALLIDANGCTSEGQIGVEIAPSPQINLLNNEPACEGETLYFLAQVLTGVPPYIYEWEGPNNFTANGPVVEIPYVEWSQNLGEYSVTVTDNTGCGTSAMTLIDGSTYMMVEANQNGIICEGETLVLSADVIFGTPPFSYEWSGPGNFTHSEATVEIPNANSVEHAGIYSVTVTDIDGCSAEGMVAASIHANPQVNISDIDPVCTGGTLILTAEVTAGTAPYNYLWVGPDGISGTQATFEVSNASSGLYSVTVTDSNGCIGEDNYDVTITPSLLVDLIQNNSVCEGGTLILSASVTTGTPPYNYLWSGPDGTSGTEATFQIPNASSGLYSVTVTDSNGCIGEDNSEITLASSLSVDLIQNNSACAGGTLMLTAEVSTGVPPYNYLWSGPEGYAGMGATVEISNPTSGLYSVTVTDSNGCLGEDNYDVTVNPELQIELFQNSPVCEGETLALSVEVSIGTPPYTFQWFGPGNFSGNGPVVEIQNADGTDHSGTYFVSVTDANGCTIEENVEVKVNQPPLASPTKDWTICLGYPLTLQSNWAPRPGFPEETENDHTFYWAGPNNFESDQVSPEILAVSEAHSGEYTLFITDQDGCESSYTFTVTVEDCAVGTTYDPVSVNYKEECCDCDCEDEMGSASSGNSALDCDDMNSQMVISPPRNIQKLSSSTKITRPNVPGPAPCNCEVNSFTGNLYIEMPMFEFPSLGPDLNFTLVYNSSNTAINSGFGNGWTWSYNLMYEWDEDGNLIISRGDGRRDLYTFTEDNYVAPPGIYDALTEVSPNQFVLETKHGRQFYFGDSLNHKLTKILDPNNNELVITYSDSLATKITDATGRSIHLEYNNENVSKVTFVSSSDSISYSLDHDNNGNLIKITDPLGYTNQYVPDVFRNIIQVTDRNGNIVDISYNEDNAVTQLKSALGVMQWEYDQSNDLTILTEPVGDSLQITNYHFDGNGRVTMINGNCCGFDVRYEYDEDNNLISKTDANENTHLFDYDNNGNVVQETDALGNAQTFSWDPGYNQMSGWTDKNGNIYDIQLDSVGQVLQITEPENIATNYTWSGTGLLLSSTDGRGFTTTYSYDSLGHQLAINYPIGSTGFDYDDRGNLLNIITPNGDSTHFEYDLLNRQMKTTDPLGNSEEVRYDGNGNEIWNKNKRGFITTQIMDAHNRVVKIKGPAGVTTEYSYDEKGNLTYFRDPNGNETSYTYNSKNLLVKEINPMGDMRTMEYDHAGNLTKETNYRGFSTIYEYDELNRVIEQIDALGHSTGYSYDNNGNNIVITSPDGISSLFEYDGHDNLKTTTHSFLGSNKVFDENDNIIEETDANGHTTKFTYDGNNRLVQVEDALQQIMTYEYDLSGNLVIHTDKNGNVNQTVYDALNRAIAVINPVGDTLSLTYDEANNLLSVTNERGFTTEMIYDSLNRVTSIIHPIGQEFMSYDGIGNLIEATDAEGRTMSYQYDGLNRLVQTTYHDNSAETLGYDENSNLIMETSEENQTIHFSFDALDRLTLVVSPTGDSTSIDYNSLGQQISETIPGGNVTHSVHDAEGRVISVYDKLGTISLLEYDDNGNLTRNTDANGNINFFTYDALNRPVNTTDANGENVFMTYDANDNLLSTTDKNGNTVTQTYDPLDRLVMATDALGAQTTTAYDEVGNIIALTDANLNTTTYEYDGNNRLVTETYADNTTIVYVLDLVGNPIQRKDNKGDLTNYIYDVRNRLVLRDYPGSNDDSFTYDMSGRMTTATNNNATITFSYDESSRLLSETLNGKTTSHAYDISNRTHTITYPSGKMVVEKMDERELINNITSEGSEVAKWYNDGSGRLKSRTYGNGTTSSFNYTSTNWVDSLFHNKGTDTFAGFNYSFDKEGNKRHEIKTHRPDHSELYSYDDNYRLTSYKRGNLPENTFSFEKMFDYDFSGNREQVMDNGTGTAYNVNEMNEYTAISGFANPIYDGNGNLTNDGVHTYNYDYENRLVSVDAGLTANYYYDALGRRIRKETISAVVDFYFDGERIIEERNGNDETQATYVYGGWIDDILMMDRNGQSFYYHHNSLGSVVAITNDNGAVEESYEYGAFGEVSIFDTNSVLQNTSAIGNPYLFTGRRLDDETGLYYYRARYYDPGHGRFLQRDPIGIWGDEYNGGNGYGYVGNNSLNLIDPYGLRVVIRKQQNLKATKKDFKAKNSEARGIVSHALIKNAYKCVRILKRGKNCYKLNLDIEFSLTMYILQLNKQVKKKKKKVLKVHYDWKKRFPRYNKEGKGWQHDPKKRTNAEERKATIAHEMDHWNTYLDFWKEITKKVKPFDGRVYSKLKNCKIAGNYIQTGVSTLYVRAVRHSKSFDSSGKIKAGLDGKGKVRKWGKNSGDMYQYRPFKTTLNMTNVPRN
ncbi:MAG: hypothetical protein DWQ02_03670 [Bacteroidetes bacterium]|nr:MAG: hypothetical protein DWQ02_03670 [Bacteroidota bacterium]